jgi:hypothetical protein
MEDWFLHVDLFTVILNFLEHGEIRHYFGQLSTWWASNWPTFVTRLRIRWSTRRVHRPLSEYTRIVVAIFSETVVEWALPELVSSNHPFLRVLEFSSHQRPLMHIYFPQGPTLRNLTTLRMVDGIGLRPAMLSHFPSLTSLTVRQTITIRAGEIASILCSLKLRHLDTDTYLGFTNEAIGKLTSLEHLRLNLQIGTSPLTSACLLPLTNLRTLSLRVHGRFGAEAIRCLTNLQFLSLTGPGIRFAETISNMKGLEELWLNDCEEPTGRITAASLRHLTNLKQLDLFCPNDHEDIEAEWRPKLGDTLWLKGHHVTPIVVLQ